MENKTKLGPREDVAVRPVESKESPKSSTSASPTEEKETDARGREGDPSSLPDGSAPAEPADVEAPRYDWRFYTVYAGLIATTLLSALDGAIVATALPTIASELETGPDYVWVANVYFLTGAVFQPLFGQLSGLWGRRWVFLSIVAIFTLGSGLCGGATSASMLIAARAVQGVGAGGINMMVDLIVCDLVPMRDRSKFLGMIFGVIGIFTAIGPLVGGALAQSGNWRWAFYLNIPIGAACMVVAFLFLRVNKRPAASFAEKMRRIDWGGVAILTISMVAVMYAVTYGGSLRPWSDPAVVGPLTAGLLSLALFALYEGASFVVEPVTPYHLFSSRTSAAAFILTFLHSILSLWMIYVFAVYFQAVLGASQTMSGIYLIPTVIGFPFAAAVGGGLMTKLGRYKPIHLAGFALITVGCGLASLLGPSSIPALWVFFQLFMAVGAGLVMACLLPAVQAGLRGSDKALSTGTWAFVRSVGVIWGVTIPAAVFNNRFGALLPLVHDAAVRDSLGRGEAYAHATAALVDSFGGQTSAEVRQVYSLSLQRVWQIAVVFAGSGFLVALLEKEVTLRQDLKTDFGLHQEEKAPDVAP